MSYEFLQHFGKPLKEVNHEEIEEILRKLDHYGHLKHDDFQTINSYIKEVNEAVELTKFIWEDGVPESRKASYDALIEECDKMNHIDKYSLLMDTRISILTMHDIVYHRILARIDSGYTTNPFFAMKDLVEQINCFYEIEEPNKPSNKIAYGWKFAVEKGDKHDGYLGFKLYLFGCIKNYLIKNGIDFDKDKSLEVRKICTLASITEGDI